MRRVGKQIVAITLAAAMMGSLTPEACTFLQNEVVYAAETNDVVYENSDKVTIEDMDFSGLDAEDWGNKKETVYGYTNDSVRKVNASFRLKTKVTIDEEAYASLGTDGYVKVQPIAKLGEGWTYTKPGSLKELKQDSFTKEGDVYTTELEASYKLDDESTLMEIDFEVVGAKAKGSISFSDVSVINEASTPAVKRTELYRSEDAKTTEPIDFAGLDEEDWNGAGKITFAYDNSINGSLGNVNEEYELTAKVTLDEASYQSLAADKAHLNIQGVTKLGSDWGWNNSTDCQWLQQDSFTKDGEKYSADLKVKFSGITPDTLMDVEFVLVGTGFKGTVTFSNVVLTNLSSDKQELTKQEPTVLSDLNDESQVNLWVGETGYQYFHGGTKNAAPELSYDANGGDGRLKVSLNYTANSGESWSEAKVKFTPETPADISNYNQVSVDLIYPESSNISKIKFFSNSGINKDTSIDSSEAADAGNGYKKVTVTLGFSPSATPMDDLTIGLIGANSSFAGDVYLDNLILSQKDASGDFVTITATPNTDGTQAKTEATDKTLTMTDPDASNSAKALYAYLQGLTESDQVLFGHQNDVSRSVGTKDELGDVHDVTGSVSGIFGIDSLALFGSEAGGTDAKSALENSINYSKKAAENGAIVTLSAHMPNFTSAKIKDNGDGTYDFFDCNFNESKDLSGDSLKKILPEGEKNKVFTAYLDTIATYANKLQESNIPVIFRPLHENTGGWFWWGTGNTAESYKSLYAYTREYLESKGVHNMLYVYSPNGPLETEAEYMSRYPGDAYVDILAFDYYNDFNTYPAESDTSFFDHLDQTCQVVSSLAKQHNKLAAISETGVRVMKKDGSDNEGLLVKNNPVSEAKSGVNWYQKVNDIAKENDMPYYMVWANFSDTNFYVPYKYSDTMGQEMINDFISYYNNEDSVFGNGTNFYGNIDKYAGVKTDNYKDVSGYMVAPFDMDTILKPTVLKASVSNAGEVSFVVKDTAKGKQLTLPAAKGSDGFYTAQLTQKEMDQIGKTDVASITLVADGKELSTITNLSIGKEKDKAPAGVLENFDYYVGSNGLLDAAYGGNSAAGCSSSFTLDQEHKADGTYGAAFNYKLKTTGSEVWTGLVNATLGNTDFSAYNALKFWTKLDGKGQKVVVQIKAGGEEYEVYLTNLAKTEDAYEVTVPFSAFKGKTGGKLSGDALKDVQAFGLWCNSNPAGSAVDVESVLYFDAFKGTMISDAEAAKADADGLIAVKQTSQSGNNGGNSSSGSSTSGGNSGSTTTPDTGNTTPDTKPSETRKTDKTFENIAKDTNATLTVEKNDKGEVTGARAKLEKTVKNASETKKTTISADVVAKLVKEAGTSDITITQTTKNASGKVMNSVSVNAKDLQAGKKLTLVKVDKKTGEKVLISSRTYKVSKDGTVTADTKDAGDYVLLNEKDAKALSSKILKSVALKDIKKTVANGKKAKVTFDKNLNMENVKKITYTSSKKPVVTVNKNGTIVAKKAGKAVVKVKVTLKNGKTKTVKMTIKVTK